MKLTHNRIHIIVDTVIMFLITGFILLCSNCQVIKVSGESMAPTLQDGERHLMTAYGEPSVGDIVIFHPPTNSGQLFIKRIAAGPGEEMMHGDEVQILADDEFFVLGDNYEDSCDSRFFGPITREDIVGIFLF